MPARVDGHIYVGSRAHAKNRGLLREFKISHVLNMTPPRSIDTEAGVPNFFEKERTITYCRCSIFDSTTENIMQHMHTGTEFVENAKYHGNVLVHCNKGVSRSVSVVLGYLMKFKGMRLCDALAKVRKVREQAQPNEAFMKQLEEYDMQLVQQRESEGTERKTSRPLSPCKTKQTTARVVKGPQLPLHLQHLVRKQESDSDQEEIVEAPIVKGPQLPPHLQHLLRHDNDDSPKDTVLSTSSCHIGPTMPSHLKHALAAEEQNESGSKRSKSDPS